MLKNYFFFFFNCSFIFYNKFQVRVSNETQVSGLSAFKYMFEDHAMDNGLVDERNKCFCRNGEWTIDWLTVNLNKKKKNKRIKKKKKKTFEVHHYYWFESHRMAIAREAIHTNSAHFSYNKDCQAYNSVLFLRVQSYNLLLTTATIEKTVMANYNGKKLNKWANNILYGNINIIT